MGGPPTPYKFGYSVKDTEGEQHREESSDGQNVRGSYGFTDNKGIHRQVSYVADQSGFKAQVQSNEPGTANKDPADVKMMSSAPEPPSAPVHPPHGGYGYPPPHPPPPPMPAAPVTMTKQGYQYSAPLMGGHVSVYSSQHS